VWTVPAAGEGCRQSQEPKVDIYCRYVWNVNIAIK
jgi:hypothetical protein